MISTICTYGHVEDVLLLDVTWPVGVWLVEVWLVEGGWVVVVGDWLVRD